MRKLLIGMMLLLAGLLVFLFAEHFVDLKKQKAQKVVVLDPGHGGAYPGFERNGLIEKHIVLSVALYAKGLLEENGYRVYMTRSKDEECSTKGYVEDLSCRPDVANEHDADIFVSIHANAFPSNPKVRGVEGFYFTPFRDKEAAEILGKAIADNTGLPLREAKFGNFKVLRDSHVPSTLLELGYVTNTEDAKLLASLEFQQKIAEGIVKGIMEYLQ